MQHWNFCYVIGVGHILGSPKKEARKVRTYIVDFTALITFLIVKSLKKPTFQKLIKKTNN